MHTHHSHSGQYCQHASNTLEEMVQAAIAQKFELMCLTEHMPRLESQHLYPEEVQSNTSITDLTKTFDNYMKEARQLQKKYADQIEILVGFEGEGINHDYMKEMEILSEQYDVDMFVGSLHHSDDTPIDFDKPMFEKALMATNNDMERLVTLYFIQLHGIIVRLRPPVIAHYDLIRLFNPDFDLKSSKAWPHVLRTIKLAVRSNCMFEVNSSALRKGWPEPYPQHDLLEQILSENGKLCLSDDSHNVEQVGLNYNRVYNYLERMGVKELYRLSMENGRLANVAVPLSKFKDWLDQNTNIK